MQAWLALVGPPPPGEGEPGESQSGVAEQSFLQAWTGVHKALVTRTAFDEAAARRAASELWDALRGEGTHVEIDRFASALRDTAAVWCDPSSSRRQERFLRGLLAAVTVRDERTGAAAWRKLDGVRPGATVPLGLGRRPATEAEPAGAEEDGGASSSSSGEERQGSGAHPAAAPDGDAEPSSVRWATRAGRGPRGGPAPERDAAAAERLVRGAAEALTFARERCGGAGPGPLEAREVDTFLDAAACFAAGLLAGGAGLAAALRALDEERRRAGSAARSVIAALQSADPEAPAGRRPRRRPPRRRPRHRAAGAAGGVPPRQHARLLRYALAAAPLLRSEALRRALEARAAEERSRAATEAAACEAAAPLPRTSRRPPPGRPRSPAPAARSSRRGLRARRRRRRARAAADAPAAPGRLVVGGVAAARLGPRACGPLGGGERMPSMPAALPRHVPRALRVSIDGRWRDDDPPDAASPTPIPHALLAALGLPDDFRPGSPGPSPPPSARAPPPPRTSPWAAPPWAPPRAPAPSDGRGAGSLARSGSAPSATLPHRVGQPQLPHFPPSRAIPASHSPTSAPTARPAPARPSTSRLTSPQLRCAVAGAGDAGGGGAGRQGRGGAGSPPRDPRLAGNASPMRRPPTSDELERRARAINRLLLRPPARANPASRSGRPAAGPRPRPSPEARPSERPDLKEYCAPMLSHVGTRAELFAPSIVRGPAAAVAAALARHEGSPPPPPDAGLEAEEGAPGWTAWNKEKRTLLEAQARALFEAANRPKQPPAPPGVLFV
eukprot:tig00020930_g16028.t1